MSLQLEAIFSPSRLFALLKRAVAHRRPEQPVGDELAAPGPLPAAGQQVRRATRQLLPWLPLQLACRNRRL